MLERKLGFFISLIRQEDLLNIKRSFGVSAICKIIVAQPWVLSLVGLFLVLNSGWYSASEAGAITQKILILNSNMSVEKYFAVQTEFKSKFNFPIVELDLGSKWFDNSEIEKSIRRESPDVIYCIGSKAYMLAFRYAKDKNLIFSSAINYLRLPMAENSYGISNELLAAFQLTLYRYFFPDVKRIGVLYSKTYNQEWLRTAVEDAKEVQVEIVPIVITQSEQIVSALKKKLPLVDALWLIADPIVLSQKQSVEVIFKECDRMQIPIFAYNKLFVNYGAILIVSVDIPTIGRQAARLASDLFSTRDIPERVFHPAGSNVTLNLRKTQKYQLKLNKEALDSVNEIIK